MIEGVVVVALVLALSSGAGFAMRRRQGKFRSRPVQSSSSGAVRRVPGTPADSQDALTADDLGAPLGARATLVQFSTEFCTFCGPTRKLLAEVAGERDGVAFIEIDAADRMDLTRRLNVLSTPTVLVLAADGSIAQRASGLPRKQQVLVAVSAVADGAPLEFPTKSSDN